MQVSTATLKAFDAILSRGRCLYRTGTIHRLLSDGTTLDRETKITRLANHHAAAGYRPSADEGVGALHGKDRNAAGERVGDPLLHHAALSQQITGPIVTAIATIITSAGEDPQANARGAGAWGLVTTDYLRPLPLEADPEPGTLAMTVTAMGGWRAIDTNTELAASATSALLRESAAHGHLEGVQRAKRLGHATQWMAHAIEVATHDGALCQRFLDRMVQHEPTLLVAMLEEPDPGRKHEPNLADRIARDVREPRRHRGALEGAALREAVSQAHREARRRVGLTTQHTLTREIAPAWVH